MDLADFRGRAGQNEINNKRVMIGAYLCSVPTTGGMRLAFGRGVGHLLTVRFNVRPEVTLFQLQPA